MIPNNNIIMLHSPASIHPPRRPLCERGRNPSNGQTTKEIKIFSSLGRTQHYITHNLTKWSFIDTSVLEDHLSFFSLFSYFLVSWSHFFASFPPPNYDDNMCVKLLRLLVTSGLFPLCLSFSRLLACLFVSKNGGREGRHTHKLIIITMSRSFFIEGRKQKINRELYRWCCQPTYR